MALSLQQDLLVLLDRLSLLPLWKRQAVLFALTGTPAVFIGYLYYYPHWEEALKLNEYRILTEQKLRDTQSVQQSLVDSEALIGMITERLIEREELTYAKTDKNSEFVALINLYLTQSGCQIISLKNPATSPTQRDSTNTGQWALKVSGNYRQITRLLALLSNGKKLFVFESINIEKEQQRLTLTALINVYYPEG